MITTGTLLRDATALLFAGTLVAAWIGGLDASLGFAATGGLAVGNLVTLAFLVRKLLSPTPTPWVVPVLVAKTALIGVLAAWLLSIFPLVAVLSGLGVGMLAITLRGVQGLAAPDLAEGT